VFPLESKLRMYIVHLHTHLEFSMQVITLSAIKQKNVDILDIIFYGRKNIRLGVTETLIVIGIELGLPGCSQKYRTLAV